MHLQQIIMQKLSFHKILLTLVPMLMAISAAQEDMVSLKFFVFPQVDNPEQLELMTGKDERIEINTPANELSQA